MTDQVIQALLVEDSPAVAEAVRQLLENRERFRITHVDRLGAAPPALDDAEFDVILLDLSLPDSAGVATVERAHAMAPRLPIVVLTSIDDDALGTDLVRCGAEDYLVKDRIDEQIVFRSVRHAIERTELRQERDRLIDELSAALEEVRQLSGLLPICAHCKRIRDGQGAWSQLEVYIRDHSEADFSHGICPECARKEFGDFLEGRE